MGWVARPKHFVSLDEVLVRARLLKQDAQPSIQQKGFEFGAAPQPINL